MLPLLQLQITEIPSAPLQNLHFRSGPYPARDRAALHGTRAERSCALPVVKVSVLGEHPLPSIVLSKLEALLGHEDVLQRPRGVLAMDNVGVRIRTTVREAKGAKARGAAATLQRCTALKVDKRLSASRAGEIEDALYDMSLRLLHAELHAGLRNTFCTAGIEATARAEEAKEGHERGTCVRVVCAGGGMAGSKRRLSPFCNSRRAANDVAPQRACPHIRLPSERLVVPQLPTAVRPDRP
eukprot:CAMPEP_0174739594 /NCGR_PEP_ID=MMETSP1094-20130205/71876_1 /TAXON_ID=156173 /ORGANISM="Chrysochromulina brevifilum, Strain UTEX LB 985" /LENGTH=239 /DNA_ID=CAMNT_0015943177 /DNA_START=40 /DNA_END=760 /DNA_ORIENTATION=-